MYHYLKYFFGLLSAFIDSTAEDMTGNGMRERGRDTRQASAHGTPALPTELNGAPKNLAKFEGVTGCRISMCHHHKVSGYAKLLSTNR